MSFTVTFAWWWLAPTIVSVLCFAGVTRSCWKHGIELTGFDGLFAFLAYLLFWVVPTLIAFLIGALCR